MGQRFVETPYYGAERRSGGLWGSGKGLGDTVVGRRKSRGFCEQCIVGRNGGAEVRGTLREFVGQQKRGFAEQRR